MLGRASSAVCRNTYAHRCQSGPYVQCHSNNLAFGQCLCCKTCIFLNKNMLDLDRRGLEQQCSTEDLHMTSASIHNKMRCTYQSRSLPELLGTGEQWSSLSQSTAQPANVSASVHSCLYDPGWPPHVDVPTSVYNPNLQPMQHQSQRPNGRDGRIPTDNGEKTTHQKKQQHETLLLLVLLEVVAVHSYLLSGLQNTSADGEQPTIKMITTRSNLYKKYILYANLPSTLWNECSLPRLSFRSGTFACLRPTSHSHCAPSQPTCRQC